ncbi:MAG: HEAT repeat domain-containing protein [Polyangiaceae bacterium]
MVLACTTLLFVVAVAAPLQAAEHVGELIQQLRTNKDFRVRTQAALALGVSGSKLALTALCSGLDDANSTVRAASAAALGKLRLGGRECLQERLQVEQHETVKQMLAKVLRTLAPGAGKAIGPDTRYYLAIGDTTNKTARPDGDIDSLVRSALDQVMASNNLLAVAPVGETADQALKLLAQHKQVKSVFIWPKVQATDEGPNLILRMSFALFSYPDKAFKGSMERKLTMPGAKSSDAKAIEELIRMAVEKIMERLTPAVDQFE